MENESWDYTENNSEENIKNPYINDQKKGFELIANLLSTPNEDEDFEQMIVFNSLCEDFFQLINDKQEDFAQEGQAYQEVLNIQTTVKNELLFPAFTTKQIIGLGGEFSSGKSSFLNSILKDDVLPTDINASTSIPTYICKNPNEKIIAYNNYGCSVELDRDALQAISHEFSDKYNLGFKHILQDIWICSKTLPYEYVKFLDTPGYSKGEFSKQDEQIALKSLRDCNALIWLIDCERGGLCETDIDFLDKISNRKTPLLIVVNKSDLKLKEEIISIKKNIEKTLTGKNFKSFTVVTYSTHNSDDFTTDFKTIDKFISRFNIPKNVLEPLLTRFLNITYAYKRHHTEQIEAHGEIIKCFNDQQLNAFFSNNGIIDKNKLHKTTQFFQTSCKFRAKFITEVEDLETKLKKCFYDLNECFLKELEMSEQDFEKERFEEAFEKAYDEKHAEFENISREKLIISLIGSVNAGKSKTINALTGIKYAEVKARAGWTKEISLYELKTGVFIADTPGLHDINEDVSKKASDFVEKNSDIILFFLNASVGVTNHEKDAFKEVSRLGKEIIIVLNKIDALDEDEIEDVIEQIKEELDATPIAISAKKGTNINELNDKIVKILEDKGKDLLFLKISRYKEKTVAKWINGASVAAASIGAIPVPGSDIIALTTLQIGLAMKIAYIYDIKPSKKDVMKLVASTVTGSIGRQLARWAITALKAAGWIPGAQLLEVAAAGIAATIAASLTYGFGWACNAYYKSGMTMDLDEVGEVFKNSYEEYKKKSVDKK